MKTLRMNNAANSTWLMLVKAIKDMAPSVLRLSVKHLLFLLLSFFESLSFLSVRSLKKTVNIFLTKKVLDVLFELSLMILPLWDLSLE